MSNCGPDRTTSFSRGGPATHHLWMARAMSKLYIYAHSYFLTTGLLNCLAHGLGSIRETSYVTDIKYRLADASKNVRIQKCAWQSFSCDTGNHMFRPCVYVNFSTLQEDFLGQVKNIAKYIRGCSPAAMMDRTIDRYTLNLKLRWERRRRGGRFKAPPR